MADIKTSSERAIEAMQQRPSITEVVDMTRTQGPTSKVVAPPAPNHRTSGVTINMERVVAVAKELKSSGGKSHLTIGRETRRRLMKLSIDTDFSVPRIAEAILQIFLDDLKK